MDRTWRGTAEGLPPQAGTARRGDYRLVLGDGEVRIRAGDREYPIPHDDVAKVYVCRNLPWEYGLCFEMKDSRDYVWWGWWRLRGAEDAWYLVKKARYPVTRTIYRPYYGRLTRWGAK